MIAIDLSKKQALYAGQKAMHQINFTAKLNQPRQTTVFFIIERANVTILHFLQETVRVPWFYFVVSITMTTRF